MGGRQSAVIKRERRSELMMKGNLNGRRVKDQCLVLIYYFVTKLLLDFFCVGPDLFIRDLPEAPAA